MRQQGNCRGQWSPFPDPGAPGGKYPTADTRVADTRSESRRGERASLACNRIPWNTQLQQGNMQHHATCKEHRKVNARELSTTANGLRGKRPTPLGWLACQAMPGWQARVERQRRGWQAFPLLRGTRCHCCGANGIALLAGTLVPLANQTQ